MKIIKRKIKRVIRKAAIAATRYEITKNVMTFASVAALRIIKYILDNLSLATTPEKKSIMFLAASLCGAVVCYTVATRIRYIGSKKRRA